MLAARGTGDCTQLSQVWQQVRASLDGETDSAYTTINRNDWGLTWNIALDTGGLLVGDQIKIALEVEAVKLAVVALV